MFALSLAGHGGGRGGGRGGEQARQGNWCSGVLEEGGLGEGMRLIVRPGSSAALPRSLRWPVESRLFWLLS